MDNNSYRVESDTEKKVRGRKSDDANSATFPVKGRAEAAESGAPECNRDGEPKGPGNFTVNTVITENSFQYRHVDEKEDPEAKSIFDIHRKKLHSLGNQRPVSRASANEVLPQVALTQDHSPPRSLLSHHGAQLLPHLQYAVISDTSTSDDSDHNCEAIPPRADVTSGTSSPIPIKGKLKKKLHDYRDVAYLERSKRARRRKRSEVDIDIGSRLSRFVSRPYEGSVDKYSNRSQKRHGLLPGRAFERRHLSQQLHGLSPLTSSNDSSPVGSLDPRSFLTSRDGARLSDFNDEQIRSYLKGKRGARRRSLSASPPRSSPSCVDIPRRRACGLSSQGTSPVLSPHPSPPASLPSNSPTLTRYRRSTFKTLLSTPNYAREDTVRLNKNNDWDRKSSGSSFFPAIHKTQYQQLARPQTHSCTFLVSTSSDSISTVTSNQSSRKPRSSTRMIKAMSGKTKKKASFPQPISPGAQKKKVLWNTSLPVGSPTFQRAMKGLKPVDLMEEKGTTTGILQEIPQQRKKKLRVRITSACGRSVGKKSPGLNVNGKQPSNVTYMNDEEYDAAMLEIRDKLTCLATSSGEGKDSPMPIKSILKNRRRSIDDLDVGTKKGLSAYLKSKQLEANNGQLRNSCH